MVTINLNIYNNDDELLETIGQEFTSIDEVEEAHQEWCDDNELDIDDTYREVEVEDEIVSIELAYSLNNGSPSYDLEVYQAYEENCGDTDDYNDIEENYQGEYSSDEDFAQQLAEDIGAINKNAQWPNNCIDWEHAASELMYDYFESNGHYFRA
jgi:antirestriction protein